MASMLILASESARNIPIATPAVTSKADTGHGKFVQSRLFEVDFSRTQSLRKPAGRPAKHCQIGREAS